MDKKLSALFIATATWLAGCGGSIDSIPTAQEYLLQPSGKNAVGFRDVHLVNRGLCPDPYYKKGINESSYGSDNQASFCREIMVRIYYPTSDSTKRSLYYRPFVQELQGFFQSQPIPGVSQSDIDAIGGIQSFAAQGMSAPDQKTPVIIFNPGYGMEPQVYENTIVDLASHGYITVSISNTSIGENTLFPDGRLVPQTASKDKAMFDVSATDIVFAYQQMTQGHLLSTSDPLYRAMDFNRVGLFGHSLGAVDTVNIARAGKIPLAAVATLDAYPISTDTQTYDPDEAAGLNIPFLRMNASDWRQAFNIPADVTFDLNKDNYFVLLSPSPSDTTYTRHNNFADYGTLQYLAAFQAFFKVAPHEAFSLGVADGRHISSVVDRYLTDFFGKYLKNGASPVLDSCQAVHLDPQRFGTDNILTCGPST